MRFAKLKTTTVVISNWKCMRDSYVRELNFALKILINVSVKSKILYNAKAR